MSTPSSASPPRQGALRGGAAVLVAESLTLPTGFAVAALLTRSLGPEGYGRYSIAATVILTLEWILVALFSRPVIKFIAEANDWRPVAATSFRVSLAAGLAAGAAVWVSAGPVASVLRDPLLEHLLKLFAIELPIFAAVAVYRSILTGIAHFRQQAIAGGSRWLSRLLWIALFVGIGWNIDGAILGNIGGVVVAALLGQAFVGSAVFGRPDFPSRELFRLVVPAFLLTLTVRLFDRFAILALKGLGGTAAEAGFYGAAQNLLVLSGIFSLSVGPVLISAVSAGRSSGDEARAKRAASLALRLAIWMFPFTAILSGASGEIVELLFGAAFSPAAPILAVLIFAASAILLISLSSGLLIALGRPWPAVLLTSPLLPLALIGHALAVPRLGALGAALVTTTIGLLAASICLVVVCRIWPLAFPLRTLGESAAVSLAIYVASVSWSTPGPWVILKSAALSAIIIGAAFAMSELTRSDLEWIRQLARRNADDRSKPGA